MDPIKIKKGEPRGTRAGGFVVDILYPGIALGADDSGIGAIGRVDRAHVRPGVVIKMHHHRDDEILTYVRGGRMLHLDSVGNREELTSGRLMMMNAGHTFQHEEHTLGPDDNEVLQIFLRPHTADLEPRVQFFDFPEVFSVNAWRNIAAPNGAPLEVRAQAWVQDTHLTSGYSLPLPQTGPGTVRLLFAFTGSVRVGDLVLQEGERLFLDHVDRTVEALSEADLVLITTDPSAPVFRGGMFSGNVLRT